MQYKAGIVCWIFKTRVYRHKNSNKKEYCRWKEREGRSAALYGWPVCTYIVLTKGTVTGISSGEESRRAGGRRA
jgi:hypothetical protein